MNLTFSSAFVAGKFCDLVVAHGTRRWNCHKVVVCSQSSVLEAKLDASKVTPGSFFQQTPSDTDRVLFLTFPPTAPMRLDSSWSTFNRPLTPPMMSSPTFPSRYSSRFSILQLNCAYQALKISPSLNFDTISITTSPTSKFFSLP